ncbi:MAG: hypothetical protein A3B10_02910 [Candidatus Doudnabacteria bacterium RIFCSPLOWO2_01_FULL_44_21]|uniref:DUF5659 domain-containing protein n=1 Tax=Candidatus Doudnabacteria bacterium RIFCSPLOWO2_01_FULL_44_21 TaxID=1817841 RepID=A0A1F5Q286_9BACT|nr:MAG: hypothetical protein A3B95_03175 [Candidatus Doudnabacteria bacterium RIFCSPHIGHO2_02_FULL_43_13b]OGE96238.1 MAG: hypothetical protein A3B10_02910 [Candidatus Doudnabacteria bacterium RIFCSPLOWO2_01_FULL_44_21]
MQTKSYQTKDFYIAAVLYASGQVISSSEWSNGKCYFNFENPKKCEQVVGGYYQNKVIMDAKKLIDAIQTIKSIIHSEN